MLFSRMPADPGPSVPLLLAVLGWLTATFPTNRWLRRQYAARFVTALRAELDGRRAR